MLGGPVVQVNVAQGGSKQIDAMDGRISVGFWRLPVSPAGRAAAGGDAQTAAVALNGTAVDRVVEGCMDGRIPSEKVGVDAI